MITGYEGYTLSELERLANQTQNKLAEEIFERLARVSAENELAVESTLKQRTKYKSVAR